ncbi:hypothetical protein BXZ70DRAFT_354120 [Cristinia sonorae]|uniref:Uncharacterized protein n=1 Tax=Cristinia sonorae TaxID=1940300 RepID=A0A8K0UKN5_9AGAR|nr:hypothetical protein BXZ70DRAFT_354120 [Cristinia sonorae]
MPILGLFSKRDKRKLQPQAYTPFHQHSNSSDGDADSISNSEPVDSSIPTSPSSYGSPHVRGANPVYGNSPLATAASSSKLKLGFRRKKSSTFVYVDKADIPSDSQLPLQQSPGALSETDIRPPARGALFSAYGDPHGAFSTRSLPGHQLSPHSRTNSRDVASVDNLPSPNQPSQQPQKKSGLFSWVQRDRKKSQPSAPRAPERLPPRPSLDLNTVASSSHNYNSDSFNLKSFRHVGPSASDPASPELPVPRPPSALSGSYMTPPARPRGNSVASDSSQRISVAAFREAAKRAHSPSPIVARPPSRTELASPRLEVSSSRPSLGLRQGVNGTASTSSLKPSPVRQSALRSSSGDSSSDESEEEESEGEEDGTLRPSRGRDTITQRSPGAKSTASSELGHRLRVPAPGPARVARSALGHGEVDAGNSRAADFGRNSSVSGSSALQSNATMERPSTMLALASSGYFDGHKRTKSSSTTSSSQSSDSDDAPLATLMMPKRPGSSASNATTGSRPRMPAKPLIDINTLSNPSLPMPMFGESSLTLSPTDEKFTPPPLPQKANKEEERDRKPTLTDRLAQVAQNAASSTIAKSTENPYSRRTGSLDMLRDREKVPNPTGKIDSTAAAPLSQPLAPSRSQTAPIGFDPTTSQMSRTPTSNGATRSRTPDPAVDRITPRREKRFSVSNPSTPPVVDLTDPTPIRPMPIRERSPPPSFSVTSRPASQLSLGVMVQQSSSPSPRTQTQAASQPSKIEPGTQREQSTVRMVGKTAPMHTSAHSTSSESSSSEDDSEDDQPRKRAPVPTHAPASSSRTPTASASLTPSPRPRRGSEVLHAPPPRTSSMYALDVEPRSTKVLVPAGPPSAVSTTSASSASASVATPTTRKRASTLVTNGTLDPSKGFTGGGLVANIPAVPTPTNKSAGHPSSLKMPLVVTPTFAPAPIPSRTRQRSSTISDNSPSERFPERPILPNASHSSPVAKPVRPPVRPAASQPHSVSGSAALPPSRPFAGDFRGNSPSASSTGDSSSGRTPLTPRDGSEIGFSGRGGDSDLGYSAGRFKEKERWGGSGAGVPSSAQSEAAINRKRGHRKSASVSFDEPEKGRLREIEGAPKVSGEDERRRERRRSEAKAAIELGNVMNGRGPLADDDDDDLPLNSMNPRMGGNMMNPMLNLTPPSPMPWGAPNMMAGGMSPMGMFPPPPPNADPAFLVAHQQAMMVAKQAYQMAVAQQAMAQANEEWERGSNATSAFGGGASVYGGMNMGMGMGGSMGMNPMGQAMFPPYGMWPNPMMFPPTAQSMYAGSVAGSDIGGSTSAAWGTRSAYGGDLPDRTSMYRNAGFSSSQSAIGSRPAPRPRTKTAPSSRPPPPPSSWKKPS